MAFNGYNNYGPQTWQVGSPRSGNMTVVDMVTDDMRHLIDKHWYQFPPMNPLWHSFLGFGKYLCLFSIFWGWLEVMPFGILDIPFSILIAASNFTLAIFCVIALLGNLCVIYIFAKTKSLRTPSNLFVINLAVADFMIMFTMGPPMVINCYYETWIFGPLACQLYGMAGSLFGCTSIWTMTMIAFDRYNVIVKGISGKPLTHGGAILRIFFVWAASLIWTIIPLLGWNRYTPEGNMTACGTDYLSKDIFSRGYVVIYACWCYFLPLFLIIYSYYFILKAVAAHEKNMREQAKKMNVASLRSSENQSQSTECKLAKVALMTISLWFMAWTPYLVINFAGIFEFTLLSPLSTIWGSVFAKANAIYNPIVYGISHPKYRAALLKTFPSLACGDKPEADSASQASGVTAVQLDEKPSA